MSSASSPPSPCRRGGALQALGEPLAGTIGRSLIDHDPFAGERTAQPGGDRRRPVLEHLAVGEHAVGAASQGPLAQIEVVVLPDREHARAGRVRRSIAATPS